MSVEECASWGEERTFRLEQAEGGRQVIRFFPCDLASPLPQDIQHRFCARCGQFFDAKGRPEFNEKTDK